MGPGLEQVQATKPSGCFGLASESHAARQDVNEVYTKAEIMAAPGSVCYGFPERQVSYISP